MSDPPLHSTASSSRRRWTLAALVMLAAWLAALGNAPGPGLTMVRSVNTGAQAPRMTFQHSLVQVALPTGPPVQALAFWAYGRESPALVVQARDPARRPLPPVVSIERSPRELRPHAADFVVAVAPGALGRAVDYNQQVGWYAVQLWHVGGAVSAVIFESARAMPRGYLSCGQGKVVRDDMASQLAPEAVKSAFIGRFRGYRLPALAPGGVPPVRKAATPAAVPPPGKAPPSSKGP